VVKIEEPTRGDPVRGAPPRRGGTSALAAILLSGVESVALDLKQPAARLVLERLLDRADVLLSSFRPGSLARLGLAAADLAVRHPRLVICSLSGWGDEGPYALRAGHDLTYQALAGTLASNAAMPALPVADLAGAWSVATAVLACLHARERTGRGGVIDASLYDAALHSNLTAWAAEAGAPHGVGQPHALSGAIPCYNTYETADGEHLALAALEPHFWRRFCNAAGRKGLVLRQYSRRAKVRRQVASLIASRPLAFWMELCRREDIPAEPILSPARALEHPQAGAREVVRLGTDRLPRLAFPARIDGARPGPGERVPRNGEHTASVLAELGLPATGDGVGARPSLWGRLRRLLGR
jgi:crotonobetainyl-CoA:carnitine CoA-transferase CaiB-like acyl-CoA transferase